MAVQWGLQASLETLAAPQGPGGCHQHLTEMMQVALAVSNGFLTRLQDLTAVVYHALGAVEPPR